MVDTYIQVSLPTVMDDGLNEGEPLEVHINFYDCSTDASVTINGHNVKGQALVELGEIIKRNLP